jgi:hypothetical protein
MALNVRPPCAQTQLAERHLDLAPAPALLADRRAQCAHRIPMGRRRRRALLHFVRAGGPTTIVALAFVACAVPDGVC